ncbi:MAG TPA: hypothetical protein VIB79_13615 [Candidatus Binatia bacterium]|jgi:hypothetical protein
MPKTIVGVMGASEADALAESERDRLKAIAVRLGALLAEHDCILMTGATTGLPHLVCGAFRERGGFSIGVSPGSDRKEHVERFGLPLDGSDAVIYTGFGLKGRNVVNVRSADVVIILGGATGTLNEFTIAYDEGKIIGVLEGTGGVADHAREIIEFCKKPTRGAVFFDFDPDRLIRRCIAAHRDRH